jgi:hypothetical protein
MVLSNKGKRYKNMIKRQYEDNKMECAFENAIDCLVYGYGKNVWNSYDLSENDKIEVWNKAKNILANM